MGLDEDFEQAAKDAKALTAMPSNDDLLILYGLFKVATVGKNNTVRPGMLDLKGKAKWDAWKKVEDKSPEDAKRDYILKVQQLQEAWSASWEVHTRLEGLCDACPCAVRNAMIAVVAWIMIMSATECVRFGVGL